MSEGIVFNTHKNVKKLLAVGLTEEQAEVHTEIIVNLVDGQLATKRDLKELELATKRDLKELEIATKRDLKELELSLKHDLTLRMGGMLTAFAAIITVLNKIF